MPRRKAERTEEKRADYDRLSPIRNGVCETHEYEHGISELCPLALTIDVVFLRDFIVKLPDCLSAGREF